MITGIARSRPRPRVLAPRPTDSPRAGLRSPSTPSDRRHRSGTYSLPRHTRAEARFRLGYRRRCSREAERADAALAERLQGPVVGARELRAQPPFVSGRESRVLSSIPQRARSGCTALACLSEIGL